MGVTRFPNGLGNHPDNHPLANLPLLDPAVSHTFFEDFDKSFIAADWTVSGTNSITPIVVDGEGGVVDLVTAGADDDATFIANATLGYSIAAGSFDVAWGCSFEAVEVTLNDLTFGLSDPMSILPADGIVFVKPDGAALIDILVRSGSVTVASALAIATLVTATRTALEFYYDASTDLLTFGVNGVGAGVLDLNGLAKPVGFLAPGCGVQAGEAAVKTLTVDYLMANRDRILNPRAV